MIIPSISQLQTQIENDIQSKLGTATWIGKSILKVLTYVLAAKQAIYYIMLLNVYKNMFADTADSEEIGGKLESFGRAKLGRNRFEAVSGEYYCTITGYPGGTVQFGQTFKSSLTSKSPGKMYESTIDVTIPSGSSTAVIVVRALEGGVNSILAIGDTIEATSPITLVSSLVTILSEKKTPTDKESIEAYRKLVLESYRLETQGGAVADYKIWTNTVEGIRTVYPYKATAAMFPLETIYDSSVGIYVESLDETANYIPTSLMLLDVEAAIEQDPDETKPLWERSRRPIQVRLILVPVSIDTIDIEITGLVIGLGQSETTIKAKILTYLKEAIYIIRPYIPGIDGVVSSNEISRNIISNVIFTALKDTNCTFTDVAITSDISGSVFSKIYGVTYESYGLIPILNAVTYV